MSDIEADVKATHEPDRSNESRLAAEVVRLRAECKRLDESETELIRRAEFAERWADKLAYAVGDIDEIGEHTNLNSPWEEAYAIVRRAGEVRAIESQRDAAIAERDKLQAFKDWVHKYLDDHGVPHHPPGSHGAEGCRIGDRMDWLMARVKI